MREIPEDLKKRYESLQRWMQSCDPDAEMPSWLPIPPEMSLIERVADLQAALKAMTEDRNLWQEAHNEDCPNLAALKEGKTK